MRSPAGYVGLVDDRFAVNPRRADDPDAGISIGVGTATGLTVGHSSTDFDPSAGLRP